MKIPHRVIAVTAILVMASPAAFAQGTSAPAPAARSVPTADARGAAEKVIRSLRNDTALRAYQWTETMVVIVNGKEKTTVVNACSYNQEGKLARTPVNAQASEHMNKGIPGTAAEIGSYTRGAVALMREYVRPNPDKLEACLAAGRVSASEEPGQRVQLTFKNYSKPGDDLVVIMSPASGHVLSLAGSSYMTNQADRAEIHTETAELPDGTVYPAQVKFDTPTRQMGVTVRNSDYRKKSG